MGRAETDSCQSEARSLELGAEPHSWLRTDQLAQFVAKTLQMSLNDSFTDRLYNSLNQGILSATVI